MFERECELFVDKELINPVVLRIVYDDDVYGARHAFTMSLISY